MMISFVCLHIAYIVGIAFLTGIIHETGHWVVARFYGYNPSFSCEKLIPTVTYENTQDYKSRLLIALAGSLPLFIFGISLPLSENMYVSLLKFMCIGHIISLAPWNVDGEVFWASIIRVLVNRKNGWDNAGKVSDNQMGKPERR